MSQDARSKRQRRPTAWRWVFVAASVLLIGVPVALAGLYASGDLCEPPYGDGDRRLTDDRYENIVETLAVRCFASHPDGTEVEETRVNWLGGGGALAFLVGTFFGAAGLVGVIRRRPAAIAAASCALTCLILVTISFVWRA